MHYIIGRDEYIREFHYTKCTSTPQLLSLTLRSTYSDFTKNEDLGVNPTDLVEFLRSASETLFQMEFIGNYPPCTQTLSILRDKAMSQ